MSKDFNNQAMKQYLLGTLPAAETERFDELGFIDDDFAGALKAAENDLVDAYVQGELSAADLEKFNSHYLASPRRRQKVEFAASFQKYAAENSKTVALAEELKTTPKSAGLLSIFNHYRKLWQFGFAAALVLITLVGGWLLIENDRLRGQSDEMQAKRDELLKREAELQRREDQLPNNLANQNSATVENEKELARVREEREALEQKLKEEQARNEQIAAQKKNSAPPRASQPTPATILKPSIASFLLPAPVRGNSQLPTVAFPPRTDFLAMRLQIEADEYPFYQVALVNQTTGQTVWQSGKLKVSNKTLNVILPAKLVKPQIYSLEVSGVKTDGEVENFSSYPFKAVPQ